MPLIDSLRDPRVGGPLDRLAALLVEDALDRPLAESVDRDHVPELVVRLLRAWTDSAPAEARLRAAVQSGITALAALDGPVRDRLPTPVVDGLLELARRPYSPDPALVARLVDQEPVRVLLREILLDTVTRFAHKLRSTSEQTAVAGALGGLGRFAKRRAGSLGALAGEVASAVGGEVERQVERKAAEFVDGALVGVMQRLVAQVADPSRADEQAALRSALLSSALGLTGPELAAELRRSDPDGLASLLRDALQGWIDSPGAEDQLRRWLDALIAAQGDRTLRATCDELGLLDPITTTAQELVLRHARALVSTDGFTSWLRDLEET